MYLLLAFTYRMTYSTSDTFFFSLMTYQYQLINLCLHLSFKTPYLANPEAVRKRNIDVFHIFQNTYRANSLIHQIAIMYLLEHKNHSIDLNGDCNNLFSEVMMLRWKFSNHSCIHMGKHLFAKAKIDNRL